MKLIALAGAPNCGKTALFNALTGSRQKVANYPGVTVERKEGSARVSGEQVVRVLDLPGTYSLDAHTPDEQITRDVLLQRIAGEDVPDLVIAVADATNLERGLSLVLEVRELGYPMVLALNIMDLARDRGMDLDLDVLSRELGMPVVPTVATQKRGIEILLPVLERRLSEKVSAEDRKGAPKEPEVSGTKIRARFNEVDRILKLAVRRRVGPSVWTSRLDRWLLHPVAGTLILFAVLLALFQSVFTWAAPLQDAFEGGVAALGAWLAGVLPDGFFRSFLVDGVIAGVGGVVVFVPQIAILFLLILFLEDSGYMARAAFIMDRWMRSVGLHGRAFIPLLSSFACAIPGIMATRTIENRRDRLATILIAPLMACSARLPVYTLLIAAFIPDQPVFGPLRSQGLVMFGLYALGVFAAFAVAFVLKKTVLRGAEPAFLMELPTYKMPGLRNLLMGVYERVRLFVRRAGTVILAASIAIWILATFPGPPEGSTEPAIHTSYAGRIGHALEPLVRPIGFDWRIATGLVPGFAAREVMVSALATIYSVEASEDDDEEAVAGRLGERIAADWSLATALSLLMWFVFAPQCISTFAVARRETNSWLWPGVMLVYLFALAYGASWVTYRVVVGFS